MSSGNDELNLDGVDFDFLSDDLESGSARESGGYYNILIADDDEAIHQVTKLTLSDFEFHGKTLVFFDTYTGKETMDFFETNKDIAIVFLDVVMEEEDSGLKVVEYMRNVLKNRNTRIVLRTGQPGKAPERQIIKDYDINDYKTKTEMTYEKIYSTVYTCLRSYRDIVMIEKNKRGLEKIVKASSTIFKNASFQDFLMGILEQLSSFCDDENILVFKDSVPSASVLNKDKNGFIAQNRDRSYKIVAATGRYQKFISANVQDIEELGSVFETISNMDHHPGEDFILLPGKSYLAYHKGITGTENFIFLEGSVDSYEFNLIKLFLSNFSIAIDNYQLTQDMIDIQKEIIFILGELIEKRSEDTAYHVRRISEISYLLAKAAGCSQEFCDDLRIASPLHDVGKISIPDSILKKPDKLTNEEFSVMKTHSATGFHLLKASSQHILRLSSEIAKSHHEKYDGSGYPDGLKGEEIPLSARIVAIADVFDALTHKRCYKEEWSWERVIEYFHQNRGTHFDPGLTDVFFSILDEVRRVNESFQF